MNYYNCSGKVTQIHGIIGSRLVVREKSLFERGGVDYILKIDYTKNHVVLILEADKKLTTNLYWTYKKATKEEVKRYHQYKKAYKLMKR